MTSTPQADLLTLTREWDQEYSAGIPDPALADPDAPELTADSSRPYSRLLTALLSLAHIRFEPFHNDSFQHYLLKLNKWILQFPKTDQRYAFLLAAKTIFVTADQFRALQRQLFRASIARLLVRDIITRRGLPPLAFAEAAKFLREEMDATIFVANSDSSAINSFVHVNREAFYRRDERHLVGPEIALWVYPQRRIADDVSLTPLAEAFEREVLSTDRLLVGKTRLVVLEDFSGSGSDLRKTLRFLSKSQLPFTSVIFAPVIATAYAKDQVVKEFGKLPGSGSRQYELVSAMTLPDRLRCFKPPGAPPMAEPSYMDDGPLSDLSAHLERLSELCYAAHFVGKTELKRSYRHGFGKLALAFSFYSNSPDNSLPMLWLESAKWTPLFRRVSNII